MADKRFTPDAGEDFRVPYPFVWEKAADEFGISGWKPGIKYIQCSPDDSEAVAEAMGTQVLHVVSVHKPGKFPTRVFYTQSWIDPNGHAFGKGACRIMTLEKFRRRVKGFAYEFRIESQRQLESEAAQ